MKYLSSLFLLMVPILMWNLLFANKLPKIYLTDYWKNIPPVITISENVFRSIVIFLPIFIPFAIKSTRQKFGFVVFLLGVLLYFSSWLIQMYAPTSGWSQSLWGFLAPSYTPLIWLVGMGLMAETWYLPIPYTYWYYGIPSIGFILFHNLHAYLIFTRR